MESLMITTTRAEVESQTRSYFERRVPVKIGPLVKLTECLVKIPDDERLRLQEIAAHGAAGRQRHQEYLAQYGPQESLYTKYGKLTTDAEREAFIQERVDSTMAAYAFANECDRRSKEAADHGASVSSADQSPNASARSAAIDMYQSVLNGGGSAPRGEQGGGAAA
jgi:hypothetical protein